MALRLLLTKAHKTPQATALYQPPMTLAPASSFCFSWGSLAAERSSLAGGTQGTQRFSRAAGQPSPWLW